MKRVRQFSEEQLLFSRIFESSFEPIVILNQQNCFLEVNLSACNLFGLTREKLLGRSIFDFLIGSLNSQSQEQIERVQIRNPNGTSKTVEYRLVDNLLPKYKLLILRDRSELKRAEEELHHQHQRVKLFSEVTCKISQSLQLKEILQTAVTEEEFLKQIGY